MDNILKRIYVSAVKLLYPLESAELYKIIVEEAVSLVKARYGSLVLDEQGELQRVYTTMPQQGVFGFRKRGLTYKSLKKNIAFIQDVDERRDNRGVLKNLGIKSTVFIPLSNKGEAIGVLVINSPKEERFSKEEMEVLRLFGSLVSLAIRKTQLYDEVKKSLEVRDLFISMAAHELRTPITTISGYVDLLHSKIPQNDSNESRWIYELKWEVSRLKDLVDELLVVNRIKSGNLNFNFSEHSLKTIAERALNSLAFTHPDRKIILEDLVKGSDIIVADFEKMLQVVTNLVDNAVKFSPADSEVIIKIANNKSNLCLQVIDKGAGIPKKDLPHIFQGFYRADNHDREGMGLGLYLIKNIVTEHNGDIKVHSKLNKGTTFEISLPKVKQ